MEARSVAALGGSNFEGPGPSTTPTASEEEVGAVLGHRTSHMVRHYTRSASRARLAEAAMKRIRRGAAAA